MKSMSGMIILFGYFGLYFFNINEMWFINVLFNVVEIVIIIYD